MNAATRWNVVRSFGLMAIVSGVAACATHLQPPPEDSVTRDSNVDQRVLAPEDGNGDSAKIARYTLAPTEVFRMPQPQQAASPELPADSPRQTLAPTTVCAKVVIDAQGGVQRVDPLIDRADCAAGADAVNADLVQATLSKVQQWRFQPAALCHFTADKPPTNKDSCDGAQSVEPVPVTLLYAFTFEVKQGRVNVRTGGMTGR